MSEQKEITFTVRTIDGKTTRVTGLLTDTIACCMAKVAKKDNDFAGVEIRFWIWTYDGKCLLDDFTLADYNIKDEDIVSLHFRGRGGG
jgi:hypothetical protein